MLVFLDAELAVYRLVQYWTCRACLLLGARAQCVLMDEVVGQSQVGRCASEDAGTG